MKRPVVLTKKDLIAAARAAVDAPGITEKPVIEGPLPVIDPPSAPAPKTENGKPPAHRGESEPPADNAKDLLLVVERGKSARLKVYLEADSAGRRIVRLVTWAFSGGGHWRIRREPGSKLRASEVVLVAGALVEAGQRLLVEQAAWPTQGKAAASEPDLASGRSAP